MTRPQNSPAHDSPQEARFAIDPQVVFSERQIGTRTTVIAQHTGLGKFFQLGAEEYRIASLLDGSRSLTEILQIIESDGLRWEAKEVAQFISKLVASQIANPVGEVDSTSSDQSQSHQSTSPPVNSGSPSRSRSMTWAQRLPQFLSLVVSQRIPLVNGDAIATRLEKRFGVVFSAVGVLYWSFLVCSGLMIVGVHRKEFALELRRMFDPGLWLILFVIWVAAKVIHEAGHAIAARYHSVRVGKIGIMFFFLAPLAYVDVTDAWRLKSRWSRVQIALAGVYLELAAAAIAAWAWWFLPDGIARHLAAQVFLVAGPATLLINANPLLRLDGYYVVSDLTEIPNLRMHGRRQLAAWFERVLLKVPPVQPLLSGWRRTFATIHAACSVVFQIVWMGGLIIGVSIWAKGLGVILALAALMLWVLLPLSRWIRKIWTIDPVGRWYMNDKRKRLLCYATLLLLAFQYLSTSNSPLTRRVPVVVRFRNEQIARAAVDAFVRDVYVTRGERVKKGMLLMELEEPELLIRRERKADDLKIAELREIQFRRQDELAKSAAESENAASLQRQLAELDQQIEGLKVIATRAGVVVSPSIENLQGRFVDQGVELLRVSDPQEKELLAAVSETDMQAYQIAALTGAPAVVRLRGGTTFPAIPATLRPRARRSLPHPALAATVGGPLPVEPSPNENEQLRVIEPCLESLSPLDPVTSVEIHAGQIGTMTISDNRSLLTRLWDNISR